MVAAREHLDRIKEASVFPIWRTLNLEADINLWLAKQSHAKPNQDEAQHSPLYMTLLDRRTGALARGPAGRKTSRRLNREDLDAIIELHGKAVELAMDRARSDGDRSDDIFYALNSSASPRSWSHYAFRQAISSRRDAVQAQWGPAVLLLPVFGSKSPPEWLDSFGKTWRKRARGRRCARQ